MTEEPHFTPPSQPTPAAHTVPASAPHKNDSGLAIASMVLGIVSIVGFLGLITGIPAIVLGSIALKKKAGEKAMSIVGIVTGAIATLISLVVIALFVFLVVLAAQEENKPYYSEPDAPSTEYRYETSSPSET